MLNITVTLTASPDLLEVLGNLFKGIAPQQQPTKETVVKELAPQQQPTKETVVKELAPVATVPPVEVTEPLGEKLETTDKITIEELRAAVAVKAKAGKKDSIKALLATFDGAESVSTLERKHYQDFKTKLEAL